MNRKRILITDGVHPVLQEELEKKDFKTDYRPDISPKLVSEMIADYHGLIINSKIRVDSSLLDRAPLLEFVARLGSGTEIIDQKETEKRGIAVFSSPGGNCNAVAEHAMGMILMWNNNLLRRIGEVKKLHWER